MVCLVGLVAGKQVESSGTRGWLVWLVRWRARGEERVEWEWRDGAYNVGGKEYGADGI